MTLDTFQHDIIDDIKEMKNAKQLVKKEIDTVESQMKSKRDVEIVAYELWEIVEKLGGVKT